VAGLPSALLERRPDIRAAEDNLIAANAQVGVAKAAYFPQLSLTGLLGGQSAQLTSLFSGPHSTWSFILQVTQPIFAAGSLKSNVRLAEAQRESALIGYEMSIQTAFTDVSNTLIAHQRVRESRVQQELLVTALQERRQLAYARYRGGVDTLLNALDADRDLFQAQLNLSQIRLNEVLSIVQLYKGLYSRIYGPVTYGQFHQRHKTYALAIWTPNGSRVQLWTPLGTPLYKLELPQR
jgi:outer membrane protein, multidrug efflux system